LVFVCNPIVAALDPKVMLVELRKLTVVLFKNKFQIVSGIHPLVLMVVVSPNKIENGSIYV
jgi:hypothetical protein